MSRALALLRLGRPLHLLGGLVLQALGTAFALAGGAALDPAAFLWGQLVISAAQLMNHYSNDYYDLEADRGLAVKPRWSGGSGVLPAGALPPSWAKRAAWACGLLALLAGAWIGLRVVPGAATLGLLGLCIFLAWAYSSPPLRLHARGLGELVGAVLLAGLTPLLGYHLQGGDAPLRLLLALAPLVCLQLAMLIAVSLPDADADRLAGKATLAVRRGPEAAARIASWALALAYAALPPLAALGLLSPAGLIGYALWAPLALWQARELRSGAGRDPARWDRLGFWAIGLVVGSALTLALGVAQASSAAPGPRAAGPTPRSSAQPPSAALAPSDRRVGLPEGGRRAYPRRRPPRKALARPDRTSTGADPPCRFA